MTLFPRVQINRNSAESAVLSAVIYFILTLLMAYTGVERHGLSMVWPVSGIALAFSFRYGPSLLPSVFIGTFLGRMVILLFILGHHYLPSIGSSFSFALIYFLETAAGYYTLRYIKIEKTFLETPKGITLFVLTDFVMSLTATVLIALLFWIMQIFIVPGHGHINVSLLFQIFLSHFIGTLIFAPFALDLFFGFRISGISKRKVEFVVTLLVLGIISSMILFYSLETRSWIPPYLAIPVILWITLRFGQGPGIMAVLFMEILFILSIAGGEMENSVRLQALGILYFQGFIAVNAMIVLYLGSLEMQKENTSTSLKRNLKRLKDREKKLTMILKGARLGTWEFDVPSGKTKYDRRWAEMLGYSPDDIAPHLDTWRNLLHPEDAPYVFTTLDSYFKGEIPEYRIEHRMKTKTGGWRWIFSTGSVIERDEEGNPLTMTGIHLDIHKEKQASMELAEIQNRFKLFMDAHPGAVYIKDSRNLSLIYGNKYMNDFLSNDDILNKSPGELFPPDIADEIIVHDKETLRKGFLELTEERPRSDGQARYFYTRKFRIDTIEGTPMLGGISYDITEQKKAEGELRKSEARVKSIFSAAPVGIGVVVDRLFTEVNQKMCDLTGYTREELIGESSRILYPSEEEYLRVGKIKYARINKYGSGSVKTQFKTKDGSILDIFLSSTPIDPSNLSTGVTFTALDITELLKAQRDLEELNRTLENRVENRTAQLTALNNELESFSYSVSHDLRAPLRGIDGFSLAVLEDYGYLLPEEGQHYLDRIRKATLRMGRLIDDLLRLSRISRKELKYETVSLSALAREVIDEFRAGEPEREVSFSLTGHMNAYGDKGLLRVVLQNLLGNSWKFTAGKDNAKIEFSRTSEGTFFVRDNGAGFDPGYAHKLFEVFQRLHTSRDFEGSGVGLATARRIIHKHGGHVWAEGEPDKGATFFFTLKPKEEDTI